MPDVPSPAIVPTDPSWADAALQDPEALLSDHAHCEKKAALTALSLLNANTADSGLVLRLARLAEQETEHLRRVVEAMRDLGLTLQPDRGNPYAQALAAQCRRGDLLDRLLVAALIEARSHERLELLRTAVVSRNDLAFLAPLLDELAACEAGHTHTYLSLAVERFGWDATAEAVQRWTPLEAAAIAAQPHRPAVH